MLVYVALSLALGIVAYILIGYPLLLAAWPRKGSRPVAKNLDYTSTVSVILAVYNGEEFVKDKLESILDLDYPPELLQIIVVSDGSSDGTESIVQEFEPRGVQLLALPHGGKAAALNAAIATATGGILFFTDVRQKLDRGALRHLGAK